ncbi:hypothetical protein HG531_012836 [Fusarium graminearum]|nr:hypothetical protein HG531_012836 [Fusarium graminearum]
MRPPRGLFWEVELLREGVALCLGAGERRTPERLLSEDWLRLPFRQLPQAAAKGPMVDGGATVHSPLSLLFLHLEICLESDRGILHCVAIKRVALKGCDNVLQVLVSDGKELTQPSDFIIALSDLGAGFGKVLLSLVGILLGIVNSSLISSFQIFHLVLMFASEFPKLDCLRVLGLFKKHLVLSLGGVDVKSDTIKLGTKLGVLLFKFLADVVDLVVGGVDLVFGLQLANDAFQTSAFVVCTHTGSLGLKTSIQDLLSGKHSLVLLDATRIVFGNFTSSPAHVVLKRDKLATPRFADTFILLKLSICGLSAQPVREDEPPLQQRSLGGHEIRHTLVENTAVDDLDFNAGFGRLKFAHKLSCHVLGGTSLRNFALDLGLLKIKTLFEVGDLILKLSNLRVFNFIGFSSSRLLILVIGVTLLKFSRNATHIAARRRGTTGTGCQDLLDGKKRLFHWFKTRCQQIADDLVDAAIEELGAVFQLVMLILSKSTLPVASWQALAIDSITCVGHRGVEEGILNLCAGHGLDRASGEGVILPGSQTGLITGVVVASRLQFVWRGVGNSGQVTNRAALLPLTRFTSFVNAHGGVIKELVHNSINFLKGGLVAATTTSRQRSS